MFLFLLFWLLVSKCKFDYVSFIIGLNIPFWFNFFLIYSSIDWEQITWLNRLETELNWHFCTQDFLFEFLFVLCSHIPGRPVMNFMFKNIRLERGFIHIWRYGIDISVIWQEVMALTFLLTLRTFENTVHLRFRRFGLILTIMRLFEQHLMIGLEHGREVIGLSD